MASKQAKDVKVTSSDNYTAMLTVDYDTDSSAEAQSYKLQLWLKKTDKDYKRYQHTWGVAYYVNLKQKWHEAQVLPSAKTYKLNSDGTTSAVTLNSNGTLSMGKDVYYKWGKSYTTDKLKNDGSTYRFSVVFECVDTIPRKGNLDCIITAPTYKITPSKPTGLKTVWDEDTRKITYKWDAATNATKYLFVRKGYRRDGTVCLKTLEVETTKKSYSETDALPHDCHSVEWVVYAYSKTGDRVKSDPKTRSELSTYHTVWVRTDAGWKRAIPWVRTNDGDWKRAIPWVYTGVTWKQTTT